MYQVAENGTLIKAEGIVLLDKLTLISGVDTSYQLTAEQKNINAPSLSWISSDESVATVGSTTGLVTVVGQGETKIIVSGTYNNKNYSAECEVTISALTIELGSDKEVVVGGSETLAPTITPEGIASREDITINWTSSATNYVTVNPTTGASTIVSVPSGVIPSSSTKSTITAVVKKGNVTLATDICIVKAIESPWIDSSYVQYNVAYTDIYTGTSYNANTGWRLLTDLSNYESTGVYEGGTNDKIEIISTGIPAKLGYSWSKITSAVWAGTEQQRKDFLDTTIIDKTIGGYNYPDRSYDDFNVYAASGLLRNFGSIIFNTEIASGGAGVNDGYGGYIAISKNGIPIQAASNPTGEELFKIEKAQLSSGEVIGVRTVTLWDIKGINDDSDMTQITDATDKRPGLFKLSSYTPDVHGVNKGGFYWLASLYGTTNNSMLCVYGGDEEIRRDSYGSGYYGVRPVISIIGAKLKLNGHVWEFVENN